MESRHINILAKSARLIGLLNFTYHDLPLRLNEITAQLNNIHTFLNLLEIESPTHPQLAFFYGQLITYYIFTDQETLAKTYSEKYKLLANDISLAYVEASTKSQLLLSIANIMAQYDWQNPTAGNNLMQAFNIVWAYLENHDYDNQSLPELTEQAFDDLLFKLAIYQAYHNKKPLSASILLTKIEAKLQAEEKKLQANETKVQTGDKSWLHAHLAKLYLDLASQPNITSHEASTYQKLYQKYIQFAIHAAQEADCTDPQGRRLIAFVGYLESIREFNEKSYANAIMNIEHSITLCESNKSTKAITNNNEQYIIYLLHLANIVMKLQSYQQISTIFNKIFNALEKLAKPASMLSVECYEAYGDYLKELERKATVAHASYHKACRLLQTMTVNQINPDYKIKLEIKLKTAMENNAVAKASTQLGLFKPKEHKESIDAPKPNTMPKPTRAM